MPERGDAVGDVEQERVLRDVGVAAPHVRDAAGVHQRLAEPEPALGKRFSYGLGRKGSRMGKGETVLVYK